VRKQAARGLHEKDMPSSPQEPIISSKNPLFLVRESLENLYEGYGLSFLESDPLLYLHRYTHPCDQELVGFLAAAFAYGQAPQIIENLRRILAPLADSVAEAVRTGSVAQWKRAYEGYTYRFQRREDLVMLLWLLRRILENSGTIQASFLRFYLPRRDDSSPIRLALTEWVRFLRDELRSYPGWEKLETTRGIYHLLPDPASGSACKRWNLYLRWMVRGPDGLDLGIWKPIATHHLVLPLDTHTARICRYLRLTSRTAPSWAMAEEITRALGNLDPTDPVRYDFSIARLGILARCTKRMDLDRCVSCELKRVCHAEDERTSETLLHRKPRERIPVSRQRGQMVP
jgi:uncharacterized protein (TIGR02757 family)